MLMITNLIEPRKGKLFLNHLIENLCPEFRNGLLDSYFFRLTLGSECLQFCFWGATFKTITKYYILQKYQSFSNQSFKQNSVHLSSESVLLNLRKIGVVESEGVDEKSDKK